MTDENAKPSTANVGDWSNVENKDAAYGTVGREYPFLVIGSADDAHQGYLFTETGFHLITNYDEPAPDVTPVGAGPTLGNATPNETPAQMEQRLRAQILREMGQQPPNNPPPSEGNANENNGGNQ